jgi:hypothetical protein
LRRDRQIEPLAYCFFTERGCDVKAFSALPRISLVRSSTFVSRPSRGS